MRLKIKKCSRDHIIEFKYIENYYIQILIGFVSICTVNYWRNNNKSKLI